MNSNPEVMRFFPTIPSKQASFDTVDRFAQHFEKYGFTYFAVDELSSKTFIGFIGMMHQNYASPYSPFVDIGWRLKQNFWGKGLATEGAKACLAFAKETLRLTDIYSVATWNNLPSHNVMHKLGLKKVDEFIHPGFDKDHELQPVYIFRFAQNN